MNQHAAGGPGGHWAAPVQRLPETTVARGRGGGMPRVLSHPARPTLDWLGDARVTVAGLGVGGLVVVSMVSGSAMLALLTSVIAIAASVLSPPIGIIALAFMAPLARPLVIPQPGLYVAMVAAMLLGVILRLPLDRPRWRLPSTEVLLLGAFLLYVAGHVVGGGLDGHSGPTGPEIASLFARLTEAVITFGVAYVVLRDRSTYPVLTALLVSATVACVLAFSQLLGADQAFGTLMEPPGESGRVSGVFADPNYFGSYLAVMIALAVACAANTRLRWTRAVLLGLSLLFFASLLLTQSRGAILSLMAGLAVIAFVHSRRTGLLVTAALVLIVAVAYPVFADWRFGSAGDPASGLGTLSGRTGAWEAGGELFLSSPLFGIGFGRFIEEAPIGIVAHNWYVQVLAELGLAGFVLWLLFNAAALVALRKRPQPARMVGYAVLVVWMVASLTLSPQTLYRITGPVLITIASAVVADWGPRGRPLGTAAVGWSANTDSHADSGCLAGEMADCPRLSV